MLTFTHQVAQRVQMNRHVRKYMWFNHGFFGNFSIVKHFQFFSRINKIQFPWMCIYFYFRMRCVKGIVYTLYGMNFSLKCAYVFDGIEHAHQGDEQ